MASVNDYAFGSCMRNIISPTVLSPFSGSVFWSDQYWHPSSGLQSAVWHRIIQSLGSIYPLLLLGHCMLWVIFLGSLFWYVLFLVTTFFILAVSQGCTIATTLRSRARMFRMAQSSRSGTALGVSLASSARIQSLWVKTTATRALDSFFPPVARLRLTFSVGRMSTSFGCDF